MEICFSLDSVPCQPPTVNSAPSLPLIIEQPRKPGQWYSIIVHNLVTVHCITAGHRRRHASHGAAKSSSSDDNQTSRTRSRPGHGKGAVDTKQLLESSL